MGRRDHTKSSSSRSKSKDTKRRRDDDDDDDSGGGKGDNKHSRRPHLRYDGGDDDNDRHRHRHKDKKRRHNDDDSRDVDKNRKKWKENDRGSSGDDDLHKHEPDDKHHRRNHRSRDGNDASDDDDRDIERHRRTKSSEDDRHRHRDCYRDRHRDDRYHSRKKSSHRRDREDQLGSKSYHRGSSSDESENDVADRSRRRGDRKKRKEKKKHSKNHRKKDKERHGSDSKKGDDKGRDAKMKEDLLDRKRSLYDLGNIRGRPPSVLLHPENNYFSHHEHLWVYLYRDEGLGFNDLTSEQSREAFSRFVAKYNKGELETGYYEDILPSEAIQQCKTTRHAWSFKTTETERKGLQLLQEGVRKQTIFKSDNTFVAASQAQPKKELPVIPQRSGNEADEKEIDPRQREVERMAKSRRLRDDVRTAMEELTGGRKEGKERQIEKRKEEAAKIHGPAQDRDEARASGVELTDDAIYGDGGDVSFQAALASERKRAARREQKKAALVQELQEKAKNKQEEILETLGLSGLQPGQKITIAPRKHE